MNRRLALAALALMAPMAAQASEPEKKKGGGADFIQLTTLAATVMFRSGQRGVMTVEAGVDATGALHERAYISQPRLRAACLDILRTYAAGMPTDSIPNADYLSTAMQRQVDQVLGRKGATLLLGTILIT
jgi:hypothetical protein